MEQLAIEGFGKTGTETKEEIEILADAKIVVVGVGGGGGNMVSHMLRKGHKDVTLLAFNTDAQALIDLNQHDGVQVLQLGAEKTKGLGAGMKPEVGMNSALESEKEIREILAGADIVFVATGLGGGTGTGASPVVARIAKESGALTVAVVTKPFMFEGRKRSKLAEAGLKELKEESDSIVIIPNDRLLKIIDRKLGMKESFEMVDEVLTQAVTGTSGIILSSGNNDINLDFADLKTVMTHKGTALMGIGEHKGDEAASIAVQQAINSPLLDNVSIDGAMGILVHFQTHPSYSMIDLGEAMTVAENTSDADADVIFGTSTDDSLDEDYVKVTLIATGFEKIDDEVKPVEKVASTSEEFLEIPTYLRTKNVES